MNVCEIPAFLILIRRPLSGCPSEEYVSECLKVQASFPNKEVHTHSELHTIPQDGAIVQAFVLRVHWGAAQVHQGAKV